MDDLSEFFSLLQECAGGSKWILRNRSIRARDMAIDGVLADTLTFVANRRGGRAVWTPAHFFEAAEFLGLTSRTALAIATANDGKGDPRIRHTLLVAVGLDPERN